MIRAALAALLLIGWCAGVGAHTGGTIGFATIEVRDNTVQYSLALGLASVPPQLAERMRLGQPGTPPDYALLLAVVQQSVGISADGTTCAGEPGEFTAPANENAPVLSRLQFTCATAPRSLVIRDDLFDALGSDYHTLANIQWPGGSQQFIFQPDMREARVVLGVGISARGAGSFLLLGIEHILIGYDHLLFLLALVLRGGNLWSLIKIVTAFTIAHSITLALAVLDVVTLPSRVVEAAIALSIAYVAMENLFLKHAVSHRWAVSFLFGLVHGFGFSSVLRELGLPAQGLVWSLLSFNVGVEVGQALAVALALPLLLWARRFKWEPPAVVALSGVVLAVGLTLFVERALL